MSKKNRLTTNNFTWNLWIDLYCERWCVARNLASKSIVAYRDALRQFEAWLESAHAITDPGRVTANRVLEYIVYLRKERKNGGSARSGT